MSFNFGAPGGGGFSFNSAPQPATATAAPLFGAPAASTAPPAGGLFGQTNPAAASFGFGVPTSSAAPPASLFGGGAPASSFSIPSFSTPAAPKPLFGGAGGGFNLGNTTTPPGTPGAPLNFGATSVAPPATSAAPSLFGGFGAPSTTPASAPPAAGGLFSGGGMFGGAGLGGAKREAESDGGARKAPGLFGNAPANPSPLSFGALPTVTASAPPSLFGAPAPASTPVPPTTTAAPFNLFSAPAAISAPAAAAPSLFGAAAPAAPKPLFGLPASSAATPAVGLFGAAPTVPTTITLKPTLSTAPTTSSPLSFTPPTSNPLTVSALSFAKPTTASPLGLGASTKPGGIAVPTTAVSTATAPGGVASTATAPVPSILRGKTLEEIVNSWSGELEERTRDFMDIAGEVREWDRVLRENGEQISALYTSILPLSPLHNQISSSLDYVESQQKDLSAILDSYEAQIGDLVEQSPSNTAYRNNSGQAEKEREKAYTLASTLSSSLDTTSTSLSSLIQTLNSLSPSLSSSSQQSQQAEDPLNQIAAILNAHLGSLKWIEGTTENLRKGVRELEVRVGEVGSRSGNVNAGIAGRSSANGTPNRGLNGSAYRR